VITTHVLDTTRGCAAAGVQATLERRDGDSWTLVASGVTNADGRLREWIATDAIRSGRYRLVFDVEAYARATAAPIFFPVVTVEFVVEDARRDLHVPLLLSPYGYSTYRGT
jgi:5-hydroxyisourate hydrolase